MNKEGRAGLTSSLVWTALERLATQGIQFVLSVILARLLAPYDYGVLALITVFISIATTVIETGLSSSIIQKKDITRQQENSIFTLNLLLSLVLYGALFLIAPAIGRFYSDFDYETIVSVIRVYSLVLPIGSCVSMQSALLFRSMEFRRFFLTNIAAVVLSGTLGVLLAYFGYGVWALVGQQLAFKAIQAVSLLLLQLKDRHVFAPSFRFREVRGMVSFGSFILLNRTVNTVYHQLRSLFIGKRYTPEDLGFYNKGETLPSMIATNTDYALQKVMFSAYSRTQDDIVGLRSMLSKTVGCSTFLLFPLMLGMAVTADTLVLLLFTEKWLLCVPYLQLFCFLYFLQPFKTSCAQALNAIGKSSVTLRLGLISKAIGVLLLLATIRISVFAVVLSTLAVELITTLLYLFCNRKFFDYRIGQQLLDVFPNILSGALMAALVVGIGLLPVGSAVLMLLLQVVVGALVYLLMSIVLKNPYYLLIKNTVFKRGGKKP